LYELGDVLGDRDRMSLGMHLEIMLLRDELGGRDRASWEMHLEAVIERVWRFMWRSCN
jgi:hypothetical protein